MAEASATAGERGAARPRRVVFCDMDGVVVLNPITRAFEPELMQQLRRVLETTEAEVVISSNWRLFEKSMRELARGFSEAGLAVPSEVTPAHESSDAASSAAVRVGEIAAWLDAARASGSRIAWVALDDMDLAAAAMETPMEEQQNYQFIRTKRMRGLGAKEADAAIAALLQQCEPA